MKLIPYLMFRDGTCRDAFALYARALGGEIVSVATYGDMGPDIPEAMRPFVANIQLHVRGEVLMGADAMENPDGQASTSVNIEVDDIAEAERIFAALADGGTVRMPLAESQWAQRFGMVDDRYGQPWMINVMKAAT